MRREEQAIATEAKLLAILNQVGTESFIRALKLFAGARSIAAHKRNLDSLCNAWVMVETALSAVEKAQMESDLEQAWFSLDETKVTPNLPNNSGKSELEASWDDICRALDGVEGSN